MATVIRSAAERWLALRRELGQQLSKRLFEELPQDPVQIEGPARKRVSLGLALVPSILFRQTSWKSSESNR